MGFFDDLAGSVQCGLSFHKGDWIYTAKDECEQRRVCERRNCYNTSYRTKHSAWSDWKYYENQSCRQERFCNRCNKREERVSHYSWTEWDYIEKNNCTQISNCTKCSDEKNRTKHEYRHDKYYTYTDSCEVHEICKRCGEKNHLSIEAHNWAVIRHPSIPNKYQRYCPRCNKREEMQDT